MKLKYIILLIGLVAGIGCVSLAQEAGKKKQTSYVKMIEASSQKTLPGIPGADAKTEFKFIIQWLGASYPETFFWRGEAGWLSCRILKAHKVATKGKKTVTYKTEFATGGNIHKGDLLELTPTTGGKFPIPAEIPATAKNTLFFKTAGSGWLSFEVKNIKAKPDKIRQ